MEFILGLWNAFRRSRIVWPLVALGVLLLFNLFFTPHFFSIEIKENHLYGNLIDILKNSSPIMLLAIGLTLVIATRGIDISVGSVVAISAGVVAILIGGDFNGVAKYPIFLAMAAAVAVGTLAGLWNGMLVSRVRMQPIIATLILFVAGRGIAMVLTNAQIIWLYNKDFFFVGTGYLFGLPFPIYLVAVVLALTALVTRRTSAGLFIESVGINPKATRFAGISA
ncbi:MAG TPA: ABC transporter permease, partial [Spirochaetia bacterium]|nr:ABC transporter permease [Spirochaetia bacterium]